LGLDNSGFSASGISASKSGFDGGVFLGYNAKVGTNFVVGLEADIGFSSAKFVYDGDSVKMQRQLGLVARAGYLAGENTLFYVKAGYDNSRIKATSGTVSESANADGVRLGLGLEHAFTDTVTARVGYDYTNGEGGFRRNQILAGVAFNF
jgi:outer membrane immunogenic protein